MTSNPSSPHDALTLSPLKPFFCAECHSIQHIKTGFSGERVKASFHIPENRLNIPTTRGSQMNFSMEMIDQYMAIFFNFSPTSSHLRPLQVENCDSNSQLVVDEDDKGKFRLEMVKV